MSFLGDVASGFTEPVRDVLGAGAVAVGADPEKTRKFLSLENPSQDIWTEIEHHPGKIIGELASYAFLPLRLFGTARGAAKVAAKTFAGKKAKRVAATALDTANQAATLGVYGTIEDTASNIVHQKPVHPLDDFLNTALFTGALSTVLHGAVLGGRKIKDKAKRSEWVKQFLIDANLDKAFAKHFARMGEADQIQAAKALKAKAADMFDTLHKAKENILPEATIGATHQTPIGNIEEVAYRKRQFEPLPPDTSVRHGFTEDGQYIGSVSGRPSDEYAQAARKRIATAQDDAEFHQANVSQASHDIKSAIWEAVPDPARREAIGRALEGEKVALSDSEKLVLAELKKIFGESGQLLLKEGLIQGLRKDYLPHYIERTDGPLDEAGYQLLLKMVDHYKKTGLAPTEEEVQKLKERVAEEIRKHTIKGKHTSFFTQHGFERKIDLPLSKIEEATGGRYRPVTMDVAELTHLYLTDIARAITARNVLKQVPRRLVSLRPKHDYIPLKAPTVVKSAFSKREREAAGNEDTLYVHPELHPTLKLIYEPKDIPTILQAAEIANTAAKRVAIYGTLFHFNALAESALMAGAGAFGAALKGAGAGYLISGGNPIGALVGIGMGTAAHVIVRTKDITKALYNSDEISKEARRYASRYIDLRPPKDVGNDIFYRSLHSLQDIVDKYAPSATLKGKLKKGAKVVNGVNKSIDILMWHRLMSGAKLITFYKELEARLERNLKLPAEQRKTQDEIAREVGQFVNDAFGGQNWRRLAEQVESKWARRWASAMASENGQTFSQLAVFAPDWTTSNIRIIAKAFPGIERDPERRRMYQKYALRAAIYWAIVANAIQYMLTGTLAVDNEDLLRIELGDGRHVTFSKQLEEPFKWVTNPLHEAAVKQSQLAKAIEEQVLNREFIGGGRNTPHITHDDDGIFVATGKRLKVIGEHYAPIFIQDIGRNGPEGVYGFFGHPIYGRIRYGFKKANGDIDTDSDNDNITSNAARKVIERMRA